MRAFAVAVVLALASASAGAVGARDVAEPRLHLVPFVSGLRAPVYVTAPRGEPGRLYVVEQAGRVRVVSRGRVLARPFLDIRSRVRVTQLQGLLSLAFHLDTRRTGASTSSTRAAAGTSTSSSSWRGAVGPSCGARG